jgi:hypothetical protein
LRQSANIRKDETSGVALFFGHNNENQKLEQVSAFQGQKTALG